MTTNIAETLDTTGLNCPLPILKTRKAIATIDNGALLKVVATDPGSLKDISSFCAQTGHKLIESSETDGQFHFLIRKQ